MYASLWARFCALFGEECALDERVGAVLLVVLAAAIGVGGVGAAVSCRRRRWPLVSALSWSALLGVAGVLAALVALAIVGG